MFDPSDKPRIFGLPLGADFPVSLIDGLNERMAGLPPEAIARVEIYVNTRRMQRRLKDVFALGPARLLPRIRLLTDLGQDVAMADLPPGVPALRRRLELGVLIGQLLEAQPDLAPRAAIHDLADSLATLMDEMQGEGVSPEVIENLEIPDQSGHWDRSLTFIRIVQRYFGEEARNAPDKEARQRLVIERLVARWAIAPPTHPVIVAGSTGSRGATKMFMKAVATLPQGALVLPGYDFDLPDHVWGRLDSALTAEDHPQFRFRHLMDELGSEPVDVQHWTMTEAPNPARNKIVSLALRPAPVTDQWMIEGRMLSDIQTALADVTLVEAASSRLEALAIALRLRQAAEDGTVAALITPDRMLTRQVTAALDRWGIRPDDSAGQPLPLSPPGRFLRHVSSLFGQKLTAEALLALLKHPLANTGAEERGNHLRWTRELELSLRRHGPPFPTAESLTAWAAHKPEDGRGIWVQWLGDVLRGVEQVGTRALGDHLAHHLRIACALVAGPESDDDSELWAESAGRETAKLIGELQREAGIGGDMSPADYNSLFRAVLEGGVVRDAVGTHPNIMIWGTMEARVQGADLVILGGLNDGTWPENAKPDPWMNRRMRLKAGLLLPERRIGLSAHDFQQAIGAQEVWLTRSIRSAEAETVASRWLNRLVNLLDGLKPQGGSDALTAMRDRGQYWLGLATKIEMPDKIAPPAPRPSPRPPVAARPKQLSVTRIKTLIRDPYAIYAAYVLRLRPLDPLRQAPDAPLRGTILHGVFERFVRERPVETRTQAHRRLMDIADEVLAAEAPWPTARRIWRAKLERVADWFLEGEATRMALAPESLLERQGAAPLDTVDFTLTAKADRIDRAEDGGIFVYDYKTGAPPSKDEQLYFDKQLLLEAAMIERNAFEELGYSDVRAASFIGLGSAPRIVEAPLTEFPPAKVWEEFEELIARYMNPQQGYTSRRAMQKERFGGDYDQLARFGEWDATNEPEGEDVG